MNFILKNKEDISSTPFIVAWLNEYELYSEIFHHWLTTFDEHLNGLTPIGFAITHNKYDFVQFFLERDGIEQLYVEDEEKRVCSILSLLFGEYFQIHIFLRIF